jgi:hypothetical protein
MVPPVVTAVLESTKVELTSALPAAPEFPEHPEIPDARTIAPKKPIRPNFTPILFVIERLLSAGDSAARAPRRRT